MDSSSQNGIVVPLSSEQRVEVFEQTGMYLHRLLVDPETRIARPMDRCCTRCLLNEGLPGVHILPSGLCNHCVEFQRQLDKGDYDESLVLELIERCRGKGNPDCVVAYSGGKDSAAALLTTIERYGLHPIAVLVDNGFIPREVQQASQAFCAQLGVPFLVKNIEVAQFTASSIRSNTQRVPCQTCIRQIFQRVAEACEEYKTRLAIGGHRFPPLSFPLSVCTDRQDHVDMLCISPLLSIRMAEAKQLDRIERAGWSAMSIAGNTSNCKLIGFVEEVFFDIYGYNPHIYEVSKEIRAGFYSRGDGLKKVERPTLSKEHRDEVRGKLGLELGESTGGLPVLASSDVSQRGDKMKPSVIVIDGFYNDVDDVRNVALNSDFSVQGNYPGLRTGPFLHEGIRNAIQDIVQRPIIYWPEDTYNGAFQYTKSGDRTWVHSDHTTNFAGVLYLTPDPPVSSGTAFFRHRETGLDYYPDDPALQAKCDADAGDFSRWIKTDVVANIYNRLALFDSNRFHASDGSFGEVLQNARLFQTFFFSVAY